MASLQAGLDRGAVDDLTRTGIVRTPVRQALPLLAQEGLLSEHETRGYVVRAFTAADIVDAIDLRGVLEGLALRRVAAGVSQCDMPLESMETYTTLGRR